jgi:hypothetical protein
MAFKMNNWSGWMADKQKFIGDEIQDRRKASGDNVKEKKKKKVEKVKTEPIVKDETPVVDARVQEAKDQGNEKYLTENVETGEQKLSSYANAWKDGRFTVSEDGKTKTAPADLGGASYANTDEGFKAYETASEQWYKDNQTNSANDLEEDSQTNAASTHSVWDKKKKK